MKKTTLFCATAITTLTALSLATSASALSVDDTHYTTDASVSFTTNTTAPEITNPDVPNPGTGIDSAFAIDYASNLDFGSHMVESGERTYYATLDKTTNNALSVVTHDQRGETTGWTLSVQQKGQFKNTSNTSLEGASLKFSSGVAMNTSSTGIYVPTFNSSLGILDPDATSATPIMSGDGTVGGYAVVFGTQADYGTNDNTSGPISLTIPSAKVGSFSTTLEYTLEAAR